MCRQQIRRSQCL